MYKQRCRWSPAVPGDRSHVLCTLYSISTVRLHDNFLPERISLLARRLFQAICYAYTISPPVCVYNASNRLSLHVLSRRPSLWLSLTAQHASCLIKDSNVRLKSENSIVVCSPSRRRRGRWSFVVHETSSELLSETLLQLSAADVYADWF